MSLPLTVTTTVGAASGLHARPASLFVQAAARQPLPVRVARPGQASVDARSLLSVMSLGAGHGETLELSVIGTETDSEDAQGAQDRQVARTVLDELAALLATDLDAVVQAGR
ncbi:phosphocarrier protein HPr [Streptacidiphilus sp. MAP12-20]|uniref:HPr family phosphocarrier protein n=1 Tax=Streptacidiphilus sp. MAP12-20 TaxID=3156299 RepID=UPI003512D980